LTSSSGGAVDERSFADGTSSSLAGHKKGPHR
jgi:hypothetical protein